MPHMPSPHAEPEAPAVQPVPRATPQSAGRESWWADPAIQWDYAAFHRVAEARWPHMDPSMTWPVDVGMRPGQRVGYSIIVPVSA